MPETAAPPTEVATDPAATPVFADVLAAASRIAPHVHRTPVATSRSLSAELGCELFCKCENLQRVGAFKARGAMNAVFSLAESEAACGVATHSSGNHGAALALAARERSIHATVVMPRGASAFKRAAVARYGATIVDSAPGQAGREAALAEVLAHTGAVFVHPSDDPRVIAGQGTAALELLEEIPDLDLLLVPVGGGGLLGGTLLAVAGAAPHCRVWATEPLAADDAARSFAAGMRLDAGTPHSVADGLKTGMSDRTFGLMRRYAAGVATVTEEQIVAAMRMFWERTKLVIEPSSAVPIAALVAGKVPVHGKRVGVILSGGNVDLDQLPW